MIEDFFYNIRDTVSELALKLGDEFSNKAMIIAKNPIQFLGNNLYSVFLILGFICIVLSIVNLIFGFKGLFYYDFFNKKDNREIKSCRGKLIFAGLSELVIAFFWIQLSLLFI